jgi:Na+-transporting NADH:ubiquinone oxidoreductase subunit NqrD
MATVRELLSCGSWFDISLFWKEGSDTEWKRWAIMGLAPGAFFTLGLLMGIANWVSAKFEKKTA